jgi:hypothetical protein
MTMVEDARIARDAINRLTTLLVKSDVTPEEILDVANDVQSKTHRDFPVPLRSTRRAPTHGLRFVTSLML